MYLELYTLNKPFIVLVKYHHPTGVFSLDYDVHLINWRYGYNNFKHTLSLDSYVYYSISVSYRDIMNYISFLIWAILRFTF